MDKQSQQFRHRCEVRWLINERVNRGKVGSQWLRDYLGKSAVRHRRSDLERDIRLQWSLGNRGDWGEWGV
jgi:hypothetical protein